VGTTILKPPVTRRRLSFFCLVFAVLCVGPACRDVNVGNGTHLGVRLSGDDPATAVVRLEGVPAEILPRSQDLETSGWPAAFRVAVAGAAADLPPVAGTFTVDDGAVVFKPLFGFDPGRQYRVEFDASRLNAPPAEWRSARVSSEVGFAGRNLMPSTLVAQVYPSGDTVPENQLRLYIHFSAPMGRKGGLEYVQLLDHRGTPVEDPFLPLDAEFWNGDRTRYTVFFDPGRQKRGILPNEEMGRSLEPGRAYTLVVSREWLDGEGQPLKEEFRRGFRVSPADERPLDEPTAWRVQAPAASSRDPLTVTFPEALDHGLLMRALGVLSEAGQEIGGEAMVSEQETRWSFTPRDTWRAGNYQLKVLSILEDLAGNRIGRAFEVDNFERVDPSPEPEAFSLPFQIR
jgi:hypothetical protein